MKNIERNIPYDPEVLDKLHRLQIQMLLDMDAICKKYDIQYFIAWGTALGAVRHKGFIPWDDDIDVGMLRKDYDLFLEIAEKEMGDKYRIMTPEVDNNYACCVTKFQRKGTKFLSHLGEKLNCEQCIFIDIFPFDCVAPTEKLLQKQYKKTLFLDRLIYLCGAPNPIIPYENALKRNAAAIVCWCAHYVLKFLRFSPRKIYRSFEKECRKYNETGNDVVTLFGDGGALNYRSCIEDMFPLQKAEFEGYQFPILKNYDEHLRNSYGDYMKLPPEDQRVNHAPYLIDFGNFEG